MCHAASSRPAAAQRGPSPRASAAATVATAAAARGTARGAAGAAARATAWAATTSARVARHLVVVVLLNEAQPLQTNLTVEVGELVTFSLFL